MVTKLEFFRLLLKQGWDMEKCMNLYQFLDIILNLHPKFGAEYLEKTKQINQEGDMKIMTTFERYGFERGMIQGIE